jgi:hypothetical protein
VKIDPKASQSELGKLSTKILGHLYSQEKIRGQEKIRKNKGSSPLIIKTLLTNLVVCPDHYE